MLILVIKAHFSDCGVVVGVMQPGPMPLGDREGRRGNEEMKNEEMALVLIPCSKGQTPSQRSHPEMFALELTGDGL